MALAKEDSKEYCKLKSPTDDIYSEAVFPRPPPMEGMGCSELCLDNVHDHGGHSTHTHTHTHTHTKTLVAENVIN